MSRCTMQYGYWKYAPAKYTGGSTTTTSTASAQATCASLHSIRALSFDQLLFLSQKISLEGKKPPAILN